MSRRIQIIGLRTTERSLLAHLLEEHGLAVIAPGEADRDVGIPVIDAADILTPPQEEVPKAVRRQGCR